MNTPRMLLILLVLWGTGSPAQARPGFEFALMGDTPYNSFEEQAFVGMLQNIDPLPVDFVIHLGDFKSSVSPCSDELYVTRLHQFNQSRHPFIYIPGDNEWTDCTSAATPAMAEERLAKLREIFFASSHSLGRNKISLTRQQSGFPENIRWLHKNVLFVGLNVPGSNNNYHADTENTEYRSRQIANSLWLKEAFSMAIKKKVRGIVILVHGNPRFRDRSTTRSGYETFLKDLEKGIEKYRRPVLLAHGDTHLFRVDQPLIDASGVSVPHLTRIEVPGSPFTDWVRVKVEPGSASLFTVLTE